MAYPCDRGLKKWGRSIYAGVKSMPSYTKQTKSKMPVHSTKPFFLRIKKKDI